MIITSSRSSGSKEIVTGSCEVLSGADGKVLWRHTGHGVADFRILVGKWIPDLPGLQIAAVATVMGLGDIAYLYAFDQPGGAGRLVWEQQICDPPRVTWCNSIIGDVDGDGNLEMVTGVGYGAIVQDCRDGHVKVDIRFSDDFGRWRHYGLMQLADVDGDGIQEVVFLDDLISLQLSVFKVAPGEPRELWCQYFGWVLPYGDKYLRVSSSSLCDIDGDGKLELTVSVLLGKDKVDWRTHVYDALTGRLKRDLPGLYLQQVQKLSPSQRLPYLIVSRESTIIPGDFGHVEIGILERGRFKSLWQADHARLEAERNYPYSGLSQYPPGTVGRNANERQPYLADWEGKGEQDLLFAFTQPGDSRASRFEVIGRDATGAFRTRHTIGLPKTADLRAAGITAHKGRLEILASDREGQLRRISRGGKALARWDAGTRFQARPIVADLSGNGRNLVLVEKAHGTVVALDASRAGTPRQLWEHSGWTFDGGLAAADLLGNGTKLAAFATAVDGLSGVIAVDARGKVIWKAPLPPVIPHPVLRTVRCWMPGHFTQRENGADLYVCAWDTPPVGAGNWDHSFALDGRTGKLLWRNDGQDDRIALHSLGPGVLPAMYDANGDGIDDVLLISQEIYTIINGADGSLLRAPVGAGFPGAKSWTAYGSIGLAWLTGQDQPDVLYRPGSGVESVFNLKDGKPLWTHDPTPGGFAVAADFDACGKPELACIRDGTLAFLNPLTGETKYQLTDPRYAPHEMCVCDINGDGRLEVIATEGSVLYAAQVADGNARLVWSHDLGMPLGAPIVADLNSDGKCEVLTCTNDGHLCAVGQ